jgi:hypothetical protein
MTDVWIKLHNAELAVYTFNLRLLNVKVKKRKIFPVLLTEHHAMKAY